MSINRFSDMPPELRRGVWHATWTPRDVEPRLKQTDDGLVTVGADLPVSAWVNRESREETLRCYKLSFSIGTYPTCVYFNFNLDTLYLGVRDRQPRVLFGAADLARVQRLSVPKWLPAGLVWNGYVEHVNFWDRAAFPVPRLEEREKLIERFAGSFLDSDTASDDYSSSTSPTAAQSISRRAISEIEPGPPMLRAARCLCATHFPALRELTLQQIDSRTARAANDAVGVDLGSSAWAPRQRHSEILSMPRVVAGAGVDAKTGKLSVTHGRIDMMPPQFRDTFDGQDWKCMAHSLEFAFGAEGYVAPGEGPGRFIRIIMTAKDHILISALVRGYCSSPGLLL